MSFQSVFEKNLIFINGKGGVGKTLLARAVSHHLASQGFKTLNAVFEDPLREPGELIQPDPSLPKLWSFNCEAHSAFEEYIQQKIPLPHVSRLFLKNKLIRYLSKAAPGIHELVLLGKIWFERTHYDRIVVDMPSTGYGLTMFQSVVNFGKLFQSGPIHKDAELMLETLRDPKQTGHLLVTLPEEMPIREAIDLQGYLQKLFPENHSQFVVNKKFPHLETLTRQEDSLWKNPVPKSLLDYALKKSHTEAEHLQLLRERGKNFQEIPYIPPTLHNAPENLVRDLASYLKEGTS
ncbi:hypothetical protein K2X30_04365 [bacterium]|jgi:anion-transporting  ArsA/GET3 family ATPase|nr:hypothetical protein [bacterium]